jgi:hypothetical protein
MKMSIWLGVEAKNVQILSFCHSSKALDFLIIHILAIYLSTSRHGRISAFYFTFLLFHPSLFCSVVAEHDEKETNILLMYISLPYFFPSVKAQIRSPFLALLCSLSSCLSPP